MMACDVDNTTRKKSLWKGGESLRSTETLSYTLSLLSLITRIITSIHFALPAPVYDTALSFIIHQPAQPAVFFFFFWGGEDIFCVEKPTTTTHKKKKKTHHIYIPGNTTEDDRDSRHKKNKKHKKSWAEGKFSK